MENDYPYSISLAQAAETLGVCGRTIRNRLKRHGDYSKFAWKSGGYWRFSPDILSSPIAYPARG
jgi:hypothetical protein